MNACLILVDFQNDYFPGGRMALVGTEKAAGNAQRLLAGFRKSNSAIIHVRHISARPGATFFLPDTDGAKINEMVAPRDGETVVVKNYPNSFRETGLREALEKAAVDTLVICGAMSHMCIDATTRAAFDHGFNCVVVEDACATKDLIFRGEVIKAAQVHAAFMAALSVPYAKVVTSNDIIAGGK